MGAVDPIETANVQRPIILFDGVCNLCNSSVKFIVKRDKKALFKFASLQSAYAQDLLQRFDWEFTTLQSIILIQNNQVFEKSDAVLKIVRNFPGAWPLLYSFIIIPKFLRDNVYDWIAKNRYRFFGRQDSCMIPSPGLKRRFIEE